MIVNSSKNVGTRLKVAESHQVQNQGWKNQLNCFCLSLSGWERPDPDMKENEETHRRRIKGLFRSLLRTGVSITQETDETRVRGHRNGHSQSFLFVCFLP